jgi:cbb3-type cytochrome oxidase subunit 3
MRLSDIMGNAGLSIYAEVALVLFVVAFLAIIWWVFRPANRRRWEADARMPLDDLHPQQPRPRKGATDE